MQKVVLGQYAEKDIGFARAIRACVERTGTSIDKLAKKSNICESTYYNHLRKPEKITIKALRVYIQTLNIPKEDIINALYLDDK